ncbi:MAG: SpaA isopeptide-forming pilin-related protein [Planctomycetota bacterium]|nr:SpaA isopeptide-forming pilin-related protein [Planctomycetota bacterium]
MFQKQRVNRRGKAFNRAASNPCMDLLEPRQLLSNALLGINPQAPIIGYDNQGQLTYTAGAQALHVAATPLNLQQVANGPVNFIYSNIGDLKIDIQIDNAGNLVGGVAGDDLVVVGDADLDGDYVPDVSGVLLTGEILQFGSLDTGTVVDKYDFLFVPTGGLLAGLYAGQMIGITMTSEHSSFVGSFQADFAGGAKGNLGAVSISVPPAAISGFNYVDANNNGVMDSGEVPIAGTTVTLTGTNAQGPIAPITTTTDVSGFYLFNNLLPGTYTVTETQPGGYVDGLDSRGNVAPLPGSNTTDVISGIVVNAGDMAAQNNFGELRGTPVGGGMTATIGFWHNKNGQKLLTCLNGSASAKNLGNWLAATFPRLYGAQAGSNNLTGKTNTQVAAYYMTLFNVKGQKLNAQVLAVAFAVYATNSTLAGGTIAAKYGFTVSAAGTGAALFNVGTSGAAFGVANGTTLSIMDILLAANNQAVNGVLYAGVTSLQNMANVVFDGINTSGDIS